MTSPRPLLPTLVTRAVGALLGLALACQLAGELVRFAPAPGPLPDSPFVLLVQP